MLNISCRSARLRSSRTRLASDSAAALIAQRPRPSIRPSATITPAPILQSSRSAANVVAKKLLTRCAAATRKSPALLASAESSVAFDPPCAALLCTWFHTRADDSQPSDCCLAVKLPDGSASRVMTRCNGHPLRGDVGPAGATLRPRRELFLPPERAEFCKTGFSSRDHCAARPGSDQCAEVVPTVSVYIAYNVQRIKSTAGWTRNLGT